MGTLLSIIALGFFLGMRHATDPDHVIAVTTIVSRQRNIRQAALIGVLWGLGHTITILIVGSAIILFGLVIPPRVGLTMELSVGLMLILLGIFYLLVFGLGTVAGMMLITAAIAVPFTFSENRFARLHRGLALVSGLVSIAFGVFIVYQMGFVNG